MLKQWAAQLNIDESAVGKLFGRKKKGNAGYSDYFVSLGWTELIFGDKTKAVKAFASALDYHPDLHNAEGTICDAVFAFILCGEEKLGKSMRPDCRIGSGRNSLPVRINTMSRRRGICR